MFISDESWVFILAALKELLRNFWSEHGMENQDKEHCSKTIVHLCIKLLYFYVQVTMKKCTDFVLYITGVTLKLECLWLVNL